MSDPLRFLILPSPLLPVMAYRPLADSLKAAGHTARIAEVGKLTDAAAIVGAWRAEAASADVLVAHSNAGLLAPLVAVPEQSVVFVDAALPPASGDFELAKGGLLSMLQGLADRRGNLPEWTRWWPRQAFDEIVPEPLFRKLDKACPRLPLSYFEQSLTVPERWADRPAGYLAFGVAYTDEREQARDWGWPWRAMQGAHLHLLVCPDEVAAAVLDLAARAGEG